VEEARQHSAVGQLAQFAGGLLIARLAVFVLTVASLFFVRGALVRFGVSIFLWLAFASQMTSVAVASRTGKPITWPIAATFLLLFMAAFGTWAMHPWN
jgi:hypothetical protein